jgi:hypothetical protein
MSGLLEFDLYSKYSLDDKYKSHCYILDVDQIDAIITITISVCKLYNKIK